MQNKPTFSAIKALCKLKQKRRVVEGITCKSPHRSDLLPDCCEKQCPHMNGVEFADNSISWKKANPNIGRSDNGVFLIGRDE